MKKLFFGLLSVLSVSTFAAGWETIKGNGVVKKETRNASGYSGISLAGSMNVQVAYGSSNTITIEADENLLPYIETKVEGDKLVVQTKKGYSLRTKSKMVVSISMTKLTSANVSGSGNINGTGDFSNSGKTSVGISGSGDININFDKFSDLDVSISGSGNLKLKGNSCNSIEAQVRGSGNIDCSTVKADDVEAHISGSGNIRVYATKKIDAKVNGSGNVYYKGDATSVVSKANGSGKVVKM